MSGTRDTTEERDRRLKEITDNLLKRRVYSVDDDEPEKNDPDKAAAEGTNQSGLRDLLQLTPEEFAATFEEVQDTLEDNAARIKAMQEMQQGNSGLARLIRGEASIHDLADEALQRAQRETSSEDDKHQELVDYAQSMGGVVVDDSRMSQEDRIASELQHSPVELAVQRIESLLERLEERFKRTEEEVMFTSSANRFAHLRSGVDQRGDGIYIPRLPPAPDWNTLEQYVEPLLRDVLDHVHGAPVLDQRATFSGLLPMDVLRGVDVVGEELLKIVAERGRAYGEESILAMGEAGMIGMIMAKVMRLMWSHRGGIVFQSRRDSYIDLAGYCLLTVALDEYIQQHSGNAGQGGAA